MGDPSDNNNNKDKKEEKKKKKRFEPRPNTASTRAGRRRRRKGPSGLSKTPTITPSSKCKLRMLKLEKVKDFLLLEEEFIRNHEVFKPHQEHDQEEREKLEELRGTPLAVGTLEELIMIIMPLSAPVLDRSTMSIFYPLSIRIYLSLVRLFSCITKPCL